MKIAIIGANGRLGAALAREYARDYEVTSYDRRQLDLGQLDRVRSALAGAKFELLINCAALTNVDYCESHREEAFVVNAEGPQLLAKIANEKSAMVLPRARQSPPAIGRTYGAACVASLGRAHDDAPNRERTLMTVCAVHFPPRGVA